MTSSSSALYDFDEASGRAREHDNDHVQYTGYIPVALAES